MDHNEQVRRLLDIVRVFVEKNKELEIIRQQDGSLYNIFDVMNLTSSEVRLHSSILASFLSTRWHGTGDAFLKSFLSIPLLNVEQNFINPQKAIVEVEKYIGPVTNTTGGRIDLYITDEEHAIIIENKIYAGDQENQMLRYYNFAKRQFKESVSEKVRLVYLTLDGHLPSDYSKGGLKEENIVSLSYKSDILLWLEECLGISARLPVIRETIVQYITTLKNLTDQNMETNNDLVDFLSQKENLDAFFAIINSSDKVKNTLLNRFLDALKEMLVKENLPFECVSDYCDWVNESWQGFEFVHKDWHQVRLSTEFDRRPLGDHIIGIVKYPHVEDIRKVPGAIELAERLNFNKKNESWFWKSFKGAEEWNNANTLMELQDGTMLQKFKVALLEVLEASEGLEL